MRELVYIYLDMVRRVGRRAYAVEVVYASSAVFLRGGKYVDVVVGNGCGYVSDTLEVVDYLVALAVERVEFGSQCRVTPVTLSGHAHSALLRGDPYRAEVEAPPVLFERREREYGLGELTAVVFEQLFLVCGVALAKYGYVDGFFARTAIYYVECLVTLPRLYYQIVRRVDGHFEYAALALSLVACDYLYAHFILGIWHYDALGVALAYGAGLVGGLPLVE